MRDNCKFVIPKEKQDKRRVSIAKLKRLIPQYMVPDLKDGVDFNRGYTASVQKLYEILDGK